MLPQLIYIALTFIGLGINIELHGKEKTGKHNFWRSFLALIIVYSILISGGFFDILF